MAHTFSFPPQTPAIVLSDDYNPVDFYDLWLKENIRKNNLNYTDFDILLSRRDNSAIVANITATQRYQAAV